MQLLLFPLYFVSCADVVVPFDNSDPPTGGENASAPYGTADWTVDCNGGGDFERIQQAIDASATGDWIIVEPCTYQENINFNGHSVYIQGRNGSADTILDANDSGYGVRALHGETSQTALVGFTIQDARGAAVYASLASIHLEDVVITGTSGEYVFLGQGADIELADVTLQNNDESTAILFMHRGAFQIDHSTLECGRSRYGLYMEHSSLLMDNSSVDCGRNVAFYAEHTTGNIQRSWLTGSLSAVNEDKHPDDSVDLYNTVLEGSYTALYGGYVLVNSIIDGGSISYTNNPDYPGGGYLVNSVVMNTTCAISSDGTDVVVDSDFFDVTPSCTGAEIVGTNGNIDSDPTFVDAVGGDYHLDVGSPLKNAGSNDYNGADLDGSDNDIGIYGGTFSMDGGW